MALDCRRRKLVQILNKENREFMVIETCFSTSQILFRSRSDLGANRSKNTGYARTTTRGGDIFRLVLETFSSFFSITFGQLA